MKQEKQKLQMIKRMCEQALKRMFNRDCHVLARNIILTIESEPLAELDKPFTDVLYGTYVRTRQALKRAGIITLRDLTAMSAADLKRAKGFGEVALENIRESLSEKGYCLQGDL